MGRLRERVFSAVMALCLAVSLCPAVALGAPSAESGDLRQYEAMSEGSLTATTQVQLHVATQLQAIMTPEFAMSAAEISSSRAMLKVEVGGGVGELSYSWERTPLDSDGNPGQPQALPTRGDAHPLYQDALADGDAYVYTVTVSDSLGASVQASTKVIVASGYRDRTLPSASDSPRVRGFSVHKDAVYTEAHHGAGSSPYAALQRAAGGKALDGTAYQIDLTGAADAPFGPFAGSLDVTLPVADKNATQAYVLGVTSSGEVVEFGPIDVIGGVVTFSTDELGVFVVAYAPGPGDVIYEISATAGEGGTIDPIGVTAYPKGSAAIYTVLPDDGYVLESLLVDGAEGKDLMTGNSYVFSSLDDDHEIAALFARAATGDTLYEVTAVVEGGNGRVGIDSAEPAGSAMAQVRQGEAAQIQFVPDAGYVIDEVTVKVGAGAAEPVTVFGDSYRVSAVTDNIVVTVRFAEGVPAPVVTHEVSAKVTAGNGSAEPAKQIVPHAGRATVSIQPDAGWKVKSVLVDGADETAQIADVSVGGAVLVQNVTAPVSVQVAFQRVSDVYIVTAQAGSGGSISPSGAQNVPAGQPVSFTITPDAGYELARLLVDGVEMRLEDLFAPDGEGNFTGSYEYAFDAVDDDHAIRAEFAALPLEPVDPTYATVSVVAGEGGRTTPSGDVRVELGGSLSIALVPDAGKVVDKVETNDPNFVITDDVSDGVLNIDNITGDLTVTVTFRDKTDADPDPVIPTLYTVKASASTGGSISPSGAVEFAAGAEASFVITPDTGHYLKALTVDNRSVPLTGALSEAGGTYAFGSISADHAIHAEFAAEDEDPEAPDYVTLGITSGSGGDLSPEGDVRVAYGSAFMISIIPDAGNVIDELTVDGAPVAIAASATSYTLFDLRADARVHATFRAAEEGETPATPVVRTVTVSSTGMGSASPSGAVQVVDGASLLVTFLPEEGYEVTGAVLTDANGNRMQIADIAGKTSYRIPSVTEDLALEVTFGGAGPVDPPATEYYELNVSVAADPDGGAPHGTASPTGSMFVVGGGSQTLYFTPETGYKASISVNGGAPVEITGASYTIFNITADTDVVVTFVKSVGEPEPPKPKMYDVEVSVVNDPDNPDDQRGAVSPLGAVKVAEGGSLLISMQPDSGYEVAYVEASADGVEWNKVQQGGTSWRLTNVDKNWKVRVAFQKQVEPEPGPGEDVDVIDIHVTVVADEGGSVVPSGSYRAAHGSDHYFYAYPLPGWKVKSVTVDQDANYSFEIWDGTKWVTAGAGGSLMLLSALDEEGLSLMAGDTAAGGVARFDVQNVTDDTYIYVDFAPLGEGEKPYPAADLHAVTASATTGGMISPSGTVLVPEGASMTYTVTADAGWQLSALTLTREGAGEGGADVVEDLAGKLAEGDVGAVTVSGISSDCTLRAEFAQKTEPPAGPEYATVHATAGPNGSIDPSGDFRMEIGESQTFLFTPAAGYVVDRVTLDGEPVTALDSSYTIFDIQRDHSLHVTFREKTDEDPLPIDPDTYEVAAYAGAGGSVWPSGVTKVAAGGSLLVRFAPDAGFELDAVTIAGPIAPAGSGDGSGSGSAVNTVTYRAGDPEIAGGQYRFSNLSANWSIYATFKATAPEPPESTHFTVSASAGFGGTISPGGDTKVVAGGSITLSLLPDEGYRVKSLSVDGAAPFAFSGNTYTLFDVRADHTVHVEFEATGDPDTPLPKTHAITASAGSGGKISPSGKVEVVEGSSIAFAFLPDEGYEVASVTVNDNGRRATYQAGDPAIAGDLYRFVSVAGDGSISVTFKKIGAVDPGPGPGPGPGPSPGPGPGDEDGDVFKVTADASEGGSILPSGTIEVKAGDNVAFSIEPAEGYKLGKLTVNGVDVTELVAGGVFVLENVQADTLVYAEFVADEGDEAFVIDAWVTGGHGLVSPSGKVKVAAGADIVFYFYPDSGYQVAWIKVDGKKVGFTAASYAFADVEADHTLEVAFEPLVPPGGIGQTGDPAPIGVVIALLVASGAVLAAVYLRRRGCDGVDHPSR